MAQKAIRINQIKLKPNNNDRELEKGLENYVVKTVGKLMAAAKMQGFAKDIEFEISKRSIDSRHKPDIYCIYSVDVKGIKGMTPDNFGRFVGKVEKILKNGSDNRKKAHFSNISVNEIIKYNFPEVNKAAGKSKDATIDKSINSTIDNTIDSTLPFIDKQHSRPVIIGFGPAGMFAALMLAEAGYRPVVYERGQSVDERIKAVESFWNTGTLDENSNVQFGEGGAGTFSDGKLNTQIKDSSGRIRKVLEEFVRFGAKPDILYVNKPHIGTDILACIVKNIRQRIMQLGGDVHFNSKLTDIVTEHGQVKKAIITNTANGCTEEVFCSSLCLAIGHSARDTFKMIYDKGQIPMEAKSFAVGLRLEHSQSFVNYNAYGDTDYRLPAADYKVTYQTKNGRGVYSFCMCPGGYVVNASSENGHLAVNGMSYSGRNSANANSAIIVTVTPKDFGEGALAGVEFQRTLEKNAYESANGAVPIQLLKDYKERRMSKELGQVVPCIKGKYAFARVDKILPEYITSSVIEGVDGIAESFKNFNMDDAVFSGVESRTSSPVRILRNEELESTVKGLFPCGEGAGYAGGITSAAVDGIKVAEKMIKYC